MHNDFSHRIDLISECYSQYKRDAFMFTFAALDHTVRALNRAYEPEMGRHVSGQELAWGIADYAREQYGPIARTVLAHWGIRETIDFGHIVFALVDAGLMRKTKDDSLEDFRGVYDFDDVLDPKRIQKTLKPIAVEQL